MSFYVIIVLPRCLLFGTHTLKPLITLALQVYHTMIQLVLRHMRQRITNNHSYLLITIVHIHNCIYIHACLYLFTLHNLL